MMYGRGMAVKYHNSRKPLKNLGKTVVKYVNNTKIASSIK